MKVALVSTYEQACGLASYTQSLGLALQEKGYEVTILAMECGSGYPRRDDVSEALPVVTCWRRDHIGVGLVEEAVKYDVVHFQHEYGLFQSASPDGSSYHNPADLLATLKALQERDVRSLVTLHTVDPDQAWFHRQIRQLCCSVVVHSPRSAALLGGGVFGKVIPHGTGPLRRADAAEGCDWLGVDPQDNLLLVPGFVSQYKAVLATIRSFLDAVPQLRPTTRLVIVGRPDGRPYGRVAVPAEVSRNPEQIIYRPGFVPANTLRHLAAAADWAVLNTTSTYGSSSGQVHSLCRYVPLAVASRPIYDQAAAAGALQYFTDGSQESQPHLVHTMVHIVGSTLTAAEVLKQQRRHADLTAWPRLVKGYYAPLYQWAAGPTIISGTEVE